MEERTRNRDFDPLSAKNKRMLGDKGAKWSAKVVRDDLCRLKLWKRTKHTEKTKKAKKAKTLKKTKKRERRREVHRVM